MCIYTLYICWEKFWDKNMQDWENYFASLLMYQDLADCSLGSVPLVTELEQPKNVKENTIKLKNQKHIDINLLEKAGGFWFLLITLVTTM